MIWKILQIEKTKDENIIRNAYRERLRFVNPEDDEEGFKELRRAYEEALDYVNQIEDEQPEEALNPFGERKNEVDRWIDRIAANYEDVVNRCKEENWKAFLSDSVCVGLDTEFEAAEKLLVFFMSHNTMPQNIWKMIDARFHYLDNLERWKEKFPENYLRFLRWQVEQEAFLDFTLFDGKTDDHIDDFVAKIYQVVQKVNADELDGLEQLFKELKRYDVTHPYVNMLEAGYFLKLAKNAKNGQDYNQKAIEIMEELDFEYSDSFLIESYYADALVANGQVDKAQELYESICEKKPRNMNARIGLVKCRFEKGELEDAKEKVEDILDDDVQNQQALDLLDAINDILIKDYLEKMQEEKTLETACKLGWCYYQKQEFEKGISLLDEFKDDESYDFVNLRCRLYLANEQHDLAYPLARKWKSMIEETVDDGSHEMKRRMNRITLAQFSLAVCIWEQEYHEKEDSKTRKNAYEESIRLLQSAVEGEKNHLVKLTYMDQMARFYLDAKQYEQCVSTCTEIIQLEPDFFPAFVQRQKAYYKMRNAKGVIDDYFSCKEIYPEYGQTYLYAAEVFYDYSQFDDVRHVIEDAKEAGISSDTLELYSIYLLHYEDPTDENKEEALIQIEKLQKKVFEQHAKAKAENKPVEDYTDITDLGLIVKEIACIYWDLNRMEQAIGIVDDYLEKDLERVDLNLLKADLLVAKKKYDDVVSLCTRLLKKKPEMVAIRLKLAKAYEYMRDYKTAVAEYETVLTIDEKCQNALNRLMYIYEFFGDREDDISHFQKAQAYASQFIDLNGSPEGYVERASVRSKLYDFQGTILDCKEAIAIDPDVYFAYVYWGVALLRERKVEEAIDKFIYAISLEESRSQVPYRQLAVCYMLQKQYHKAIEMYETIMKKWENEFGLCEEVANCYALLGEYKKSCELYMSYPPACLKWYNEKATEDSHHARMVMCYCDCIKKCSENRDYKLGDKYIKKAMKELSKIKGSGIMPNSIENIVEYYRDQGDYKTAIIYARNFLDFANAHNVQEANCENVLFAYATVLLECRKKEQARDIAKRYLAILLNGKTEEELFADKRYINMWAFNLAIVHLCLGEISKAKESLNKIPGCTLCSTCVSNDCFEYYFAKGIIAEIENDYEHAKACYEKAIDIKGYYPCAAYHLEKLNKK